MTVLDGGRPTREALYKLLSGDLRCHVAPLGKIDVDELQFARSVGCRRTNVMVAHIHDFW